MSRQIAVLALFAAATAVTASFGAMFLPGTWYASLAKPSWTPPNWVFGPVWTALYVMIAAAGWLAWRAQGMGRAVAVWAAALVANGLWSWLFFGSHQIAAALADILVLLALILVFIMSTWRSARWAALLFVPYLLWVTYATSLNTGIWLMNP